MNNAAIGINLPPPPMQQQPDGSMAPAPPMYQPMEGIQTPHHNDVLCGRGVTTNRHPGNENFRGFVNRNKALYVTSTKRQKMTISRSIVEAVRNLSPPGRFLEKDVNTGLWSDIGDKKAVEKTSQALRDGAASLRKLLSDDLNDPDVIGAFCEDPKNMEAKLAAKRKALKEKALRAAEAVNSPKQETSPGGLMMDTKSPSPAVAGGHHMHAPVVSPNGSEISPHSHHMHHGPPRHGEYDSHYRYPQDHASHERHRNYEYYQGQHPGNYTYPGSHGYKDHRRGHDSGSPPRRRMDRYQEMDISPPPSPRIEHSSRSRPDHGGYWSGMNKDSTSSLFRELKHHASTSMIRENASRSSYNRHPARSSYTSHDRFPSPPQNRNTPTNFVEVTQEGFYQCSSSRGTVTGRFRNSNDPYYQGSSSHHPYETRTPSYNTTHEDYSDNGLVTPSPTRSKLMSSSGYHDTKKYFEPPPPQRSRSHHHHHQQHSSHYRSSHQQYDDYNNRHDDYNRNYQKQYYSPHQYPVPPPPPSDYDEQPSPDQHHHYKNSNPTITPSPKNRNVVYHHHHHHSATNTTATQQAPPTPPNPNMFKDPFADMPPTPPTQDAFETNSFKSNNSTDAWLTDSPIFLPMEEDTKPESKPKELETRTHSDTSRHSSKSSSSMKSDVTPLPFRSSPTNSFSPFLGYLCCGPSFCEQQTASDSVSIQPWCGPQRTRDEGPSQEEKKSPPVPAMKEASV